MKAKIKNIYNKNAICIGTGLVALDVVISGKIEQTTQFYAGGSCGNVLTILAYMGWSSFPIARLSNNVATELLIQDLDKWSTQKEMLTFTDDGSTPIIIHRILKDKAGHSKHRFEFRNPEDGKYLPSYKPCLSKLVPEIVQKGPTPHVFYFDRINRASIDLAKTYKEKGALIFFEPSSIKDGKGFQECIEIADVVKFAEDRIPNFDSSYKKGQARLEIQTLGEKGLKYREKGTTAWTSISGYYIDNVIDTAGAGDWCTAGIIESLLSKEKNLETLPRKIIESSLKFGQILSAINCTYEGARGLMYNKSYYDLRLIADTILNSDVNTISQATHQTIKYQPIPKSIKISSLFAR